MALTAHLNNVLIRHQCHEKKLVVALSGGVDSVVLLDALVNSAIDNNRIDVVHVHHGLSELADDWLLFCQQLCIGYGINFNTKRVKLVGNGKGIEAAARQARYQALNEFVDSNSILLTAQHQDDQCETLLLALKRGSGIRGLGAMPESLLFGEGKLLRPLLSITRKEVESYAADHQLRWVEDDSNSDSYFDRNFLRLNVIPTLSKRWPMFKANVARTAQLCQEGDDLLNEIAAEDLSQVQASPESLSIDKLAEMSPARINNVIRYWLSNFVPEMPSQALLLQITTQMLSFNPDRCPCVDLGGMSVRRYLTQIYIVAPQIPIKSPTQPWSLTTSLSCETDVGTLTYRHAEVGVRKPRKDESVEVLFSPIGRYKAWPQSRDKRRSIKKLLQEYRVPTWQRGRIPFVFYNDRLVAAVGLWCETQLMASEGEEAIEFELLAY